MSPTLSVCLFVNDPPAFVAENLGVIREVADEIVVAVDSKVPVDRLGPLEGVADVLVRRRFVPPLEANLDWLHSLCSGDWILRLDGDQTPSHELVQVLASTPWWEGVTHLSVRIAWLDSDGTSILDQHPWVNDYAIRLVRSLPGIVERSDDIHSVPEIAGRGRILDAPIYELGLAVDDRTSRGAKVTAYRRSGGIRRTDLGLVVDSTYYLPENLEVPPRTRPLPAADEARLDRLVTLGRSESVLPTTGSVSHPIPLLEDSPVPSDGGFGCLVEIREPSPLRWVAGRNRNLYVRVTNTGALPLAPKGDPPARLAVQLLEADGTVTGEECRAELPSVLAPGAVETVLVNVGQPPPGGSIRVGIVREGVEWIDPSTFKVSVARQRRVALSSGVNPSAHLGDDLVAAAVLEVLYDHFPDVEPVLTVDLPGDVTSRLGARTTIGAGAVIHRNGRAGRLLASARTMGLLADARRFRRGRALRDRHHAALLTDLAESDVLLMTPAGALSSGYATESLLPKVAEALAARVLGVPVIVEGASVGPITHPLDRFAVGLLARVSRRFTVRDPASAEQIPRLGRMRRPVAEVPDLATAVHGDDAAARELLAASGVDPQHPYVVLSLRDGTDGSDASTLLGSALRAVPDDWPVVFVAHCHDEITDDRRALRALPVPERVTVLPPAVPSTAVGVVSGAAFAIGTRFHLAVLASAAGVPAIAVASSDYDHLRLSGQPPGTVTVIDGGSPPLSIEAAVRQAVAGEAVVPARRWDPTELREALRKMLPSPPPLP